MGAIATIGLHGWDPEEFLGALTGAVVGVVLDLRPQTAAGSARYSWADPRRLEAMLAETGIEYRHQPVPALTDADLGPIAALAERTLPALLGVEREPEGCRRGLVAERLEREYGLTVIDFRPRG